MVTFVSSDGFYYYYALFALSWNFIQKIGYIFK